MPRYRKKPVIIEAFQYHQDKDPDLLVAPDWFIDEIDTGVVNHAEDGTVYIKTLEGTLKLTNEDFIIKGIKGEIYPCKPDIFEATYELVEE